MGDLVHEQWLLTGGVSLKYSASMHGALPMNGQRIQ